MNADEINKRIAYLIGDDAHLRADEVEGIVYLRDDTNEADVTDESAMDIDKDIYDWAIFAGYTAENFEEFVA